MLESVGVRSTRGRIPAPAANGRMFAAKTGHLDSGAPVVMVMGEVDLSTAPVLEETLFGLDGIDAKEVVVDLTGCSFLDSRGLRALIETKTRLERSDRSLALAVSNPNVLRIFQITGCDKLFEIFPSLGAAVNANGK